MQSKDPCGGITQQRHFSKLGLILCCTLPMFSAADDLQDLKAMSLEELANLEVSIVGKRPGKLSDTAAAVYVITAEDIRRSTATRLPELLRMVPGLNVARLDESEWAISARGFNDRLANKLLVMIDGRSVYTPFYSGVIWEAQDLMLEDIERIEVIRGPGAATWGANAVNGVINIITKAAADTRGTLAAGLLGNEQNGAWLRQGFEMGKDQHARVYVKTHHHEPFTNPDGSASEDDWSGTRAGFRVDRMPAVGHSFTLQGDFYTEDTDSRSLSFTSNRQINYGGNLLGRWESAQSDEIHQVLQFYYDQNAFSTAALGDERLDTVDLEYHQEYTGLASHALSYGLGYRWLYSEYSPVEGRSIILDPERTTQVFSAFIQDDIQLIPEALKLTLGMKLEHNDYSGLEIQPNVRMNWRLAETTSLWGAISRAVRTPSRGEHDLIIIEQAGSYNGLPLVSYSSGDPDFESEELVAYELGLRSQPSPTIGFDLALFYNDYNNLRSLEVQQPVPDPLPTPTQLITRTLLGNNLDAQTYGLELALDWRLRDWWRMQLAYSYLRMLLDLDPTSTDPYSEAEADYNPRHQLSLHSAFDIDAKTELDLWGYYAHATPDHNLSAYFRLDLRLAHRLNDTLTLELVGRNLLDPHHSEFVATRTTPPPKQVDREVFLKLIWRR